MAADGLATKNPTNNGTVEMVIGGLAPGKHSIVTYHNEVRELAPASFDVFVDKQKLVDGFIPTKRATNDYEVASTFLEVAAVAGQDVVIRFQPVSSSANQSLIINGFGIDTVNPRLKAIKPSPANDDEHWPNGSALTWAAPATAVAHRVYLGTASNLVATATLASPVLQANLAEPYLPAPQFDPTQT